MDAPIFTPEEMQALRAPFPLSAHTIREGHKEGGKIRWFVYIDRSAVQDRLDELFPGEWHTPKPEMYPVQVRKVDKDGSIHESHEISAVMGLVIRGVERWDAGESDDGSAKSAITNAFRRVAAYGFGIARYLYDMGEPIKTDTYTYQEGGKWKTDWDKRSRVQADAWGQFVAWYKQHFEGVPAQTPTVTNQYDADAVIAATSDLFDHDEHQRNALRQMVVNGLIKPAMNTEAVIAVVKAERARREAEKQAEQTAKQDAAKNGSKSRKKGSNSSAADLPIEPDLYWARDAQNVAKLINEAAQLHKLNTGDVAAAMTWCMGEEGLIQLTDFVGTKEDAWAACIAHKCHYDAAQVEGYLAGSGAKTVKLRTHVLKMIDDRAIPF